MKNETEIKELVEKNTHRSLLNQKTKMQVLAVVQLVVVTYIILWPMITQDLKVIIPMQILV